MLYIKRSEMARLPMKRGREQPWPLCGVEKGKGPKVNFLLVGKPADLDNLLAICVPSTQSHRLIWIEVGTNEAESLSGKTGGAPSSTLAT